MNSSTPRDMVLASLAAGGLLLTANRRLARRWRLKFDERRLAEGQRAWTAPSITAWDHWVAGEAATHFPDLLTPDGFAERLAWEQLIEDGYLLDRAATAQSASEAWGLSEQYGVPLDDPAFGYAEDTAQFRAWAREWERSLAERRWLPSARRERMLAGCLTSSPREIWADGFDDRTPAQQKLFAILNPGEVSMADPPAADVARVAQPDARSEIRAAAAWARDLLERGQAASVGIVIQDLAGLRPAVEGIFADALGSQVFNISLGTPLATRPVVSDALLWLRWLGAPLPCGEAGVLLRSPFFAGAREEAILRANLDSRLREDNFVVVPAESARPLAPPVLGECLRRAFELIAGAPAVQRPGAWARLIPDLLAAGGWPGSRSLDSAEYQTVQRWNRLLREFAALDSVRDAIGWGEAVRLLASLAGETVFQPESEEQPIQILEALQAAGSRFDALWVAGLSDVAWPPPARPNPFLPRSLQAALDLPRATPARQLRYARELTDRLLRSAPLVRFSYPTREEDEELRPSRLLAGLPEAAPPRPVPGYRIGEVLVECRDTSAPPLGKVPSLRSGVSIITEQSLCPFRAFAKYRLRAGEWAEPEPGITAMERGNVLHDALAALARRFPSRDALLGATAAARNSAIRDIASTACGKLPPEGRQRLLALEQRRLEAVLEGWVEFELNRDGYTVEQVEQELDLSGTGIPTKGRLDRLDRLPNGELALLDYKSGSRAPSAWTKPRPTDLQLPLYAISLPETPTAIAFAVMKRGAYTTTGLGAAKGLLPGVNPPKRAWTEQVEVWRTAIDTVWTEFQEGRADVDPNPDGHPCTSCHLAGLCRVKDSGIPVDPEEEGADAAD